MFDDHSVASVELERLRAGTPPCLADPEAFDDQPILLGLRLLSEGRVG